MCKIVFPKELRMPFLDYHRWQKGAEGFTYLFSSQVSERKLQLTAFYMSNYEYVHIYIYIYLFIYLFGGSPSKIIRRHKQQRKETQRRKGTITRKNKHIAFIFDSTFIDTYMHPCTLRLLCFFVDAIDMRLIFPV